MKTHCVVISRQLHLVPSLCMFPYPAVCIVIPLRETETVNKAVFMFYFYSISYSLQRDFDHLQKLYIFCSCTGQHSGSVVSTGTSQQEGC